MSEGLPNVESCIRLLSSEVWPYHGKSKLVPESLRKKFTTSAIGSDEQQAFWILLNDSQEKIGIVRLFDLSDAEPMFDLRIRSSYRGKGVGKKTLQWATEYVFKTFPDKVRILGYTREDNLGIRKIFCKCGYCGLWDFARRLARKKDHSSSLGRGSILKSSYWKKDQLEKGEENDKEGRKGSERRNHRKKVRDSRSRLCKRLSLYGL